MRYLIIICALAYLPMCQAADGWHLAVGLGVHDPAYDWHQHAWGTPNPNFPTRDYYEKNPLGIVKLHYESGRWDIGVQHVSSIPNTHDDHGLTFVYVTVDVF